jgi:predicted TIM-barrel fold metal-dependent hydrolase
MPRRYRAISADSHLEVAGDRWEHRVSEKHRHWNPKRVSLPGGGEAHLIEGQPIKVEPGRDFRNPDWRGVEPRGGTFATNDGGGPPEKRLSEQDIDGIDAEVLFLGTTAGPNYWRTGIKDDEAYAEVIGAYNGWLAEEYCAVARDRLIGLGFMPQVDAETAVAELEHCVRLGLKGVQLNAFPDGKMYPTPADDLFWAAAAEMGMPVTAHVEFGERYDGPLFQYEKAPEGPLKGSHRDPIGRFITPFGNKAARDVTRMVFSGMFDRFPSLQIYFAETQVGWIPMWLQELDDSYERNHIWAYELYGVKKLDRMPSEYVKDHFMWGFMKDPFGVRQRHEIGLDRIMWEADFPHSATDWPHSQDTIAKNFVGVPYDERHQMLVGNAARFFHLDAE